MPQGSITLWPTEMLNSRRIPNEDLGATPETCVEPGETHLIPQILGNEPVPIRESVLKLRGWGARGIDINMGCPVRKALKHNYGVALMGDPAYAAEVVRMAVSASDLPVSVKLRAGPQGDLDFLLHFVEGLEKAGASWISLHPRAAHLKRRGVADWDQIKWVRDRVGLPVIGNGDVQQADDVFSMIETTGCDAVMVGRALTARPWLVWQVGEKMGLPAPLGREGQRAPLTQEEEGAELGRAFEMLVEIVSQYFSESLGLRKLNFFVRNAHPWLEFGHAWMASLTRSQTYNEMRERTQEFFSRPQRMMSRTELRY